MKDKYLIEGVLRRGTKNIPGLADLEYEERLKKVDILSMRHRRIRGDMIEAYIYTHEMYHTNQILVLDPDTTRRGHNFKLKTRLSRTATRQHFFSNRVAKDWNSLPWDVVNAPSLNTFKSRLDKHWDAFKYVIDKPNH